MRPTRSSTRLVFFGGLLGLLLGGTACAVRSGPITSQVLDAQTNQPIAGAVVLGVWTTKGEGIFGAHAPTKLVGVQEVETDAEGRFTLARPGMVAEDDEKITVYKFGYVAWSNLYTFPSFKRRPETDVPAQIRLEYFPPGGNHREHMRSISLGIAAGVYDEMNPKFQKAIDHELRMR